MIHIVSTLDTLHYIIINYACKRQDSCLSCFLDYHKRWFYYITSVDFEDEPFRKRFSSFKN